MKLNHLTPLSSDCLSIELGKQTITQHSHQNKTNSLFLFTDFTDILFNVNVALIDVVSLVVNVFNKNQNNNNNLLTNAAKCQIVSPVLRRVLQ